MPDPQTLALIRASQGDTSQLPPPSPDTMQANPQNIPQPGAQPDIMQIFRQLLATPEVAQPRSAMEEQRGRLQGMEQQYADMPLPQTAPHNLALRILAATAPGRAISNAVYEPGVERYGMQRRQLADQIASLKGQTDISKDEAQQSTQLAGTAGTAGYRTGELQLGAQRNQIAAQKAQTYAESIQNKLQMGMRGLDLRALQTGSTIELNKAKIMLDQVLAQTLPARVEVEQYGIDTNSATRQAVADLEAQAGLEKTHPFLNLLDQSLGTHLMPSAPQTPGGAQPVRGAQPLPPKGAPKSPIQPKGKVLKEGVDF